MLIVVCRQRAWKLGVFIAIVMGAMLGLGPANAQTLPDVSVDFHLGVTSCKSSGCHGSVTALTATNVAQNEFIIWQQQDPHSKAYTVLLNDQSKRIAANLGLKDAHTAKICLDCHTDNVPEKQRGRQFQLSDGVGCEACHGGSFRWIGPHLAQQGHPFNVANGMFPTTDPVKRAELCLSCHFGNSTKFVNHRIMGAGHPRMPFELDTFSWTQPAHFEIDADYRKRKTVVNGVKTWAVGQAMAIARTLDSLMDPNLNKDGIFPELVFFDCHACHHPMSNLRWQPRKGTGLGPGMVRLNDANLIMLRVIMRQLDKELGDTLARQTLALHGASTQGSEATANAAKELRQTVQTVLALFVANEFPTKQMTALLEGVVNEGLRGEFVDYAAAEQATMALGVMVEAIKVAAGIEQSQYKSLKTALEGGYEVVKKDEAYNPLDFVSFLREFKNVLKIEK